MSDRDAKRALFEQFARVARAAAHPARLELLELLAQGERSVDELAVATESAMSTVSAQLQELRRARLVDTRRDGTRVHYRLAGDDVARFVVSLRELAAAHLGDVDVAARDYLGDETQVEALDRDELRQRAAAGDIVVIDVRPSAEYRAGHIPGAISVPLDELDARLADLPDGLEIVAYCRGPYCVFAHEAVRRLRRAGRRARRLVDGLPEWRLAGLPVTAGAERGRLVLGAHRPRRDQRL